MVFFGADGAPQTITTPKGDQRQYYINVRDALLEDCQSGSSCRGISGDGGTGSGGEIVRDRVNPGAGINS